MTFANLRMPLNDAGTSEVYAFGGYSHRDGNGQGFRRCAVTCASFIQARNWLEIYPEGFLPNINGTANDYSAAGGIRGVASGWSYEIGAEFGHNDFEYNITNTLNVSLGPCLDPAAPALPAPTASWEPPTIPVFQIRHPSSLGGCSGRSSSAPSMWPSRSIWGWRRRSTSLSGRHFAGRTMPYGRESWRRTSTGFISIPTAPRPVPGSQVFAGFTPDDATDDDRTNFGIYADAETDLTPKLLANVAARFESYSDFGEQITGKAALRFQPSPRVTFEPPSAPDFGRRV